MKQDPLPLYHRGFGSAILSTKSKHSIKGTILRVILFQSRIYQH